MKLPLILSVSTMEILKEGRQLHHDALKQRKEDINVGIKFFEKGNQEREDPLELRNQIFPPYTPLKSLDEISCSGGEL